MKIRSILEKVVREISSEYSIPEEDVWEAAINIKEIRRSI